MGDENSDSVRFVLVILYRRAYNTCDRGRAVIVRADLSCHAAFALMFRRGEKKIMDKKNSGLKEEVCGRLNKHTEEEERGKCLKKATSESIIQT